MKRLYVIVVHGTRDDGSRETNIDVQLKSREEAIGHAVIDCAERFPESEGWTSNWAVNALDDTLVCEAYAELKQGALS